MLYEKLPLAAFSTVGRRFQILGVMDGSGAGSWNLFLDDGEEHLSATYPAQAAVERDSWPEPSLKYTDAPVFTQDTGIMQGHTDDMELPHFVEVKFHECRTQIVKNTLSDPLSVGEYVVTQADRGYDFGQIVSINSSPLHSDAANAKYIIRKATPQDIMSIPERKEREKQARDICQQKADEIGLPMTITATEYQFDGKKLTVYFSATQYIDFRGLVHTLFRVFGTRIWMVWYDGRAPVRDVFTHTRPRQVET